MIPLVIISILAAMSFLGWLADALSHKPDGHLFCRWIASNLVGVAISIACSFLVNASTGQSALLGICTGIATGTLFFVDGLWSAGERNRFSSLP